MKAIQAVDAGHQVRALNAVRDYALTIPSANGRVGRRSDSAGAAKHVPLCAQPAGARCRVPSYGPMPTDPAAYAKSGEAPILGLLAGNDARVNNDSADG